MVRAFLLSVGQLRDRRMLAVLAKSLAITVAVLVAVSAALVLAARWLARDMLSLGDGAGTLAAAAAVIGAVLLGWVLFRIVAVAVVGLFGDEVVAAVEARHYPARLHTARPVPFARSAAMGVASAGRTLGVNLLLVPVYLVLLATGIGTALLFLAANGWLLGRDLWDMVAVRHLPEAAIPAARRASRWDRFGIGLFAALLLSVPVLNFVAPILAAAVATHRFHRNHREP